MKKFFITMLLLLILGGVVFYFGWAQFRVPVGAYGIVHSKTHGIDPNLIRSGEFRWLWYMLIPTNVQIVALNLDTVNHSINTRGTLPSGDTYAAFTGINADFSWEIRAAFSFRLDSEQLISLASRYNFNSQEDLTAFEQDLAQRIETFILRQWFLNQDNQRLEEIMLGGLDLEIQREVERQFPQILDFSFVVNTVRFPDFALYRQTRLLFEDFIAAQREFISVALAQQAQAHINTQLRFAELERYGQLFERYPALLQFLAMERASP